MKPLYQISMPNLVNNDMDSLIDDIITKIQSDSEWNSNWDGELWQNAFQMILQLFTYLFERNATSVNMLLKEKFLNQAFSEQSIYDNLSDMHIQLQQATAAEVNVICTVVNDILKEPLLIPRFYTIYGTNPDSKQIPFEVIKKDESTNKYNYFDNTLITPNVETTDHFDITLYAGTTFNYEYTIDQTMFENFIINLSEIDIEEDSIQIFYKTGAYAPIELPFTDTFVVAPDIMPTYFPNGKPHWTLRYNANGSASILFGNALFGGAFDDTHVGNKLIVYGRSGVGAKTNVLIGGINSNQVFTISQARSITINFTNIVNAAGGSDSEDIYEAQVFAPYRYGKGKPIIDKKDAQNKLLYLLAKHEIETPQYDPEYAKVQLLHAYHYCVPKRDFSTFTFPEVEDSDTSTTYNTKFLEALNIFCNIVGSHESAITGERVIDFIYPPISGNIYTYYTPAYKYPLSGTLSAIAYNYNEEIVDSITWKTNYITDAKAGNPSYSSAPSENGYFKTNAFTNILIQNSIVGRNDLIVFTIDQDLYNYTFTIQMTPGIKTYQSYATELAALVREKIVAEAAAIFGSLVDYAFITYEAIEGTTTGRVVFNSPSVGANSKIIFKDNGTLDTQTDPIYNIYLFFGIERDAIYRPQHETGTIFDTNNTFRYYTNEMAIYFQNANFDKTKTKTYSELNVVVNHSSVNGPLLSIILNNEKAATLERLFEDETLKVTVYNSSDEPIDYIEFTGISSTADTSGTLGDGTEFQPEYTYTPGSVIKDSPDNKYVYSTASIYLRLLDNVIVPYYNQTYPSIYEIRVVRLEEDPGSPGTYIEDETWTPISWFETAGEWTQDPVVEAGKTVTLSLTTTQNNLLVVGDYFKIKIYNRDEYGVVSMIESGMLRDIAPDITSITDLPITEVCIDQAFSNNEYDKTAKRITFKLLDGTENTSITYYDKTFMDFAKIIMEYKGKTYEYVALNYTPNPYYPEGEANTLMNILSRDKSTRMIGLEHLIKLITFVPKGITIQLTIKKNYSTSNAINAVRDLLNTNFSYDNENPDHTINSLLTFQAIKNIISTIANEYGISDIIFTGVDDSSLAYNNYKFLLDTGLYNSLQALEDSYENIDGISNQYSINITAIYESMRL